MWRRCALNRVPPFPLADPATIRAMSDAAPHVYRQFSVPDVSQTCVAAVPRTVTALNSAFDCQYFSGAGAREC